MSWIEQTDSVFRNLNLLKLKVDQAYLNITSSFESKLHLYFLAEECEKCPFEKYSTIMPSSHDNIIKLNTSRGFKMRLYSKDHGKYLYGNETDGAYYSAEPNVGEFGVYDLILMHSGANKFQTAKEPVNTTIPLFVVAAMLVLLYWCIKAANRFYFKTSANPVVEENTPNDNEMEMPKVKKRLKSLDIFRGIAIVLMIFVNSGGGHYWWMEHADWNGLHVADLVFPWFLFIMGVCIPMSIKSQVNRQTPKREIVFKIMKRSLILFMLGLFLNTSLGATFHNIRTFGVLQRFGIAYLVVSIIHLAFVCNNVIAAETRFEQLFYDIKVIWKQWIIILAIVLVHLIVIFGFPVPECGRGYLGPGGKHENLIYQNCTGGAAGLFDRSLLGENHMYQKARIRNIYGALVFDPEGIFGCLLTIVQVFLGVQCGVTLLIYPTCKERIRRWLSWSLLLGIITGLLTFFSQNDGIIPINKNLWSLSYVTATAGLAYLLLSIIYYLVDVKNIGDDFWTIFLYPGMNAILLYVGHTIFHKMYPFHWQFQVMNTHFLLLLENIWTTLIWIAIAHKLYHKKIFYSI